MKILILGYADEAGNGAPVAGKFSEADFEKAKRAHRFPKGVKCLVATRVEEYDRAIFLGHNIGDALEAAENQRAAAQTADAKAVKSETKEQAAISAAAAAIQTTARARNELLGKFHQAKTSLRNHELTSENLRGESWGKNVAELKKLILGDTEKKITGLEDEVKSAVAAYEKAVADHAALAKPINETLAPAPQSQLVEA